MTAQILTQLSVIQKFTDSLLSVMTGDARDFDAADRMLFRKD